MLALKQKGAKVIAIAPPDQYSEKISALGISYIPVEMEAHRARPWNDLIYFGKLLRLYLKIKPSLIYHYTVKPNIYGSLAAFLAGRIPSVCMAPGRGSSFEKKGGLFYLTRLLYRLTLRFNREVWFLNEEDRRFFVRERMIAHKKTLVLPGEGVDTEFYSPTDRSSGAPLNRQAAFNFLLSGRMMWQKGVGVFVQAARLVRRHYPHTQFQLLGFLDSSDQRVVPSAQIEEWEKEGIATYLGEAIDVRPFLRQADCFVLPSFYGEGLPMTLLEAASMSLPIITTDHPGCHRAVADGLTGMLCRPNDAQSLAEKMIAMLQCTLAERLDMGKKGRELIVRHFEESIVVNHYLSKSTLLLAPEYLTHLGWDAPVPKAKAAWNFRA